MQQYTFSESHRLFKAPQSYPEPPKDMWYKVPEAKPKPAEQPKPIFPWERDGDRPKATRVFAEDLPPSPQPTPATVSAPAVPGDGAYPFSTVHYGAGGDHGGEVVAPRLSSPERASSPKTADEQWQEFQQSNANAWDSVPGIDTYVRAIMEAQARRGKSQILQPATGPEEILSPSISRKDRRESLIITDFPTAVERPSLPVTPAPVRRPTFWGEERDEQGELPAAEGVPDQASWVCPQCGFSSVNASDFRPVRRESSTSTTTAIATSPQSTTKEIAVELQPVQPTLSPQDTKTLKTSPTPPEPHPRSGISPRGAPLASLTDPALLDPVPHFPGFSVPTTTSASDVPSIPVTSM